MSTEMLLAKEKLIKAIRTCLKNNHQPLEEKSIAVLLAEENLPTLGNTSNQLKQEEQDSSQYWKPPVYYSDDDDDFYRESIDETPPSDAITPDLPITDSLVMEDEHLDTIPETDSDEENESSVEDLNLTPSESEDLSDIESECDVPVCDDFTTFSNPLFDSYNDSTSSDDESFSDEDVPKENFKIYSNPLFDEEIISTKIDPHHFNAESDLIESLLNKNTVITSPKIDFLLEEFAGELALINPIPPGIAETNFDPKEDIRLIKKLLYDNSSPRPPEELNSVLIAPCQAFKKKKGTVLNGSSSLAKAQGMKSLLPLAGFATSESATPYLLDVEDVCYCSSLVKSSSSSFLSQLSELTRVKSVINHVENKWTDVKSAFLYGKIEEEVYVYQPPGFEYLEFLDRVYRVEKALYGLHQAPRAWYETLSTYLLDNEFLKVYVNYDPVVLDTNDLTMPNDSTPLWKP
ncbi:hypothetical protein Tco_0738472 [Tanacetum coccineum]